MSKTNYYSAIALKYWEKADAFGDWRYLEPAEFSKFYKYTEKARYFEGLSNGLNVNFFGVGTVFSVGIGAYCTHNFCEGLINKFADYYQNNADKITNSYKEALSYFIDSLNYN